MSVLTTSKIPATVITGFLGAGKTSLLRHLIEQANGRRYALIINEFGDLGVDRELLNGCGIESFGEDDVVELTNGCICCTVADDFLPTIEALLDRAEPPDHILIETSGLALPKPLVQAFAWPEVRTRVTVDGVIAVIDGEAVADGQFASDPEAVQAAREADPSLDHESPLVELFEEQIQCADLVVMNKRDRLNETARDRATQALNGHLRPAVKVIEAAHGVVDPAVLLGLDAAAETDLDSRPSHIDTVGAHDHDDFESFVVAVPELADPAHVEARIRAIAASHDVLRVKGFLAVTGKPMRHVVQAVGDRITRYYDRAWRSDEPRQGNLVVIGETGLDQAAIAATLSTAGPDR